MADALKPAVRRRLRQRAHALRPVVLIGAAGVSDAVTAELHGALAHHELVKIRFHAGAPEPLAHATADLCARLSAHPVQRIGRVVVLYRENPRRRRGPDRATPRAQR